MGTLSNGCVPSFLPTPFAVVNALAIDAAVRQVLGVNVTIDITVIDETNSRVKVKDILARFRKANGFGLVGLVGVQSNQFPRAVDIARPLRAAGIPVLIGGFHVSGCLAMLPELPADLREALDLGICLFAGEAEDRFDSIVQDAAIGRLKPIYNYLNELPPLESSPIPFLSSQHLVRTFGKHTSFDAGRGCPYQCSFCTIINVQRTVSSFARSPNGGLILTAVCQSCIAISSLRSQRGTSCLQSTM